MLCGSNKAASSGYPAVKITLFPGHETKLPTLTQAMRLYQPIWEKLKREGKASVTANRVLHARILKAVIKEKWLDLGYKLEIAPYHCIVTHSRSNSVLTFYLTKHLHPSATITLQDI